MMIKKIALALTLSLAACSSANSSEPAPSCLAACLHGDSEALQTDAGGSCSYALFGTDEAACEDACSANQAASCMTQAATCAAWTLCTEHAQTGVGALPPSRVHPYEEVESCTRPGPAPGQTCPPGVRCCH